MVRRKGAWEGEKEKLVVVCQNWSRVTESLGVGPRGGKEKGVWWVVGGRMDF